MVRNVIAIILGLVVGFIVVAAIEMVNYGLFPLPEGLDITDSEGMIEHVKSLPALAYVIVLIAHFAGSFMAAFAASKVADFSHLKISLGLGGFFMLMGLINFFTIPHPGWFVVMDLLVYLPAAYLGFRVSNSPVPPEPE